MNERKYSEDFIAFAGEGADEAAEIRSSATKLEESAHLATMLQARLFGDESSGRLTNVSASLSEQARGMLLLANEAEAHVINDIIDNDGLEAYTAHRRTQTARQIGMVALVAMSNPKVPFYKDLFSNQTIDSSKKQKPSLLQKETGDIDSLNTLDLQKSNFTRYINKKQN